MISNNKDREMEFTGERFVSTLNEPEICYEHWHRYLYASNFVEDKVVLDIASGEGYGSFLLSSSKARNVFGVDIDPEAVTSAKETYKNENLEFITGSISAIPLPSGSIDVLISFETIEHVDQAHQDMFLNEIERVLKPDGILIISTPNKLTYSDIPKFNNEFHIKEFYVQEFLDFLRPKFKYVELLGHKIYSSSYIWSQKKSCQGFVEYNINSSDNGFVVSDNSEKEMLYAITVCSNIEHPQVYSSILIDQEDLMMKHKNDTIERLTEEIGLKDLYITEKIEEHFFKDQYIAEKIEELLGKDQYIAEKTQELLLKDEYITEITQKIIEKDRSLLDSQAHINKLEEQLRKWSVKYQLQRCKLFIKYLLKRGY